MPLAKGTYDCNNNNNSYCITEYPSQALNFSPSIKYAKDKHATRPFKRRRHTQNS